MPIIETAIGASTAPFSGSSKFCISQFAVMAPMKSTEQLIGNVRLPMEPVYLDRIRPPTSAKKPVSGRISGDNV